MGILLAVASVSTVTTFALTAMPPALQSGTEGEDRRYEVGGVAEAFDFFGARIAHGDFDDDGAADLALGVPFDHSAPGGVVHVVYGPLDGGPGRVQTWTQDTPGSSTR